jgi:hypothetical protein
MANAAENRKLLLQIQRLTDQLLKQMEAYGDLYGHRPEERAETRRGFLFAQHVERMLRDRSERARDIKEMLGDHARG